MSPPPVRLRFDPRSFATFLLILALEIAIALGAGSCWIRHWAGDVLVVVLLVALLEAFVRLHRHRGVAAVFAFACAVELAQLADPAALLGLGDVPGVRIVLGATFDPIDIVAYAVGAALALALPRTTPVPAGSRHDADRVDPTHHAVAPVAPLFEHEN